MAYTRDELISISEDSVVPCENWDDRDSASAQENISQIYARLKAGIAFKTNIEGETIWIQFDHPDSNQIDALNNYHLDIDTVSDFREKVTDDYDTEMFEPGFTDCDSDYSGYMPTREKLDSLGSLQDWY